MESKQNQNQESKEPLEYFRETIFLLEKINQKVQNYGILNKKNEKEGKEKC